MSEHAQAPQNNQPSNMINEILADAIAGMINELDQPCSEEGSEQTTQQSPHHGQQQQQQQQRGEPNHNCTSFAAMPFATFRNDCYQMSSEYQRQQQYGLDPAIYGLLPFSTFSACQTTPYPMCKRVFAQYQRGPECDRAIPSIEGSNPNNLNTQAQQEQRPITMAAHDQQSYLSNRENLVKYCEQVAGPNTWMGVDFITSYEEAMTDLASISLPEPNFYSSRP